LKTWFSEPGKRYFAQPCSTGFINPKHDLSHEIGRNSKQYPMFQIQMFKTAAMAKVVNDGFVFDIWSFDI
jgi:hypothetical protein